MTETIEIIFDVNGIAKMIYNEELNLTELGGDRIKRVSHVEPVDGTSSWEVRVPVTGDTLGPFNCRSDAVKAEIEYIKENNVLSLIE